jgi:hypothetical protein
MTENPCLSYPDYRVPEYKLPRKIVEQLSKDPRLGAFSTVGCSYRTPEGNACAVGCLISDELVKELGELGYMQTSIHGIKEINRSLFERILEETGLPEKTLEGLQRLHDRTMVLARERRENPRRFLHEVLEKLLQKGGMRVNDSIVFILVDDVPVDHRGLPLGEEEVH